MQLELFCAEELVRGYEQRIASHIQRERHARFLARPRCDKPQLPAHHQPSLTARLQGLARRQSQVWCMALPRRWSPCPAPS